jgi:hypothetical protein
MLVYDQPPQFLLKSFFRPLATLEVEYGLEEAGLLFNTMANVSNFEMQPIKVSAFFKKTAQGLKLDWEIFAQTKYKIFGNFINFPDPGASKILRVIIAEDVPNKGKGAAGTRTYRLGDPANQGDATRFDIKIDTEIGRTLSVINWRGIHQTRQSVRTATVELEWTSNKEAPELKIKRFICWEFLGLGGEEISEIISWFRPIPLQSPPSLPRWVSALSLSSGSPVPKP